MDEETRLSKAISREISPKNRAWRAAAMYLVAMLSFFVLGLYPEELVWKVLVVLVGLNLIAIITYAEELANK